MADNILSLTQLEKSYGLRTLFSQVTLGLDQGQKLGLIGDNGSGKSTLLKIIAQRDSPDGGHVALRQGIRIGFLEQVPVLRATSIQEVLAEPLAPLRQAIADYEARLAQGDSDAQLLDDIERLGGWDWQHKVDRFADELGLGDTGRNAAELSGGQQKRVALGRLRLQECDLVLLDEPTNHLDADTVAWIESWLASAHTAAVVVTHDRYFLDAVVDRMAELRDGTMRTYMGNYSDYLIARAEEEALRDRTEHRQLQVLKTELEWARRGPKARTTKQKARLERLDAASSALDKLASRARISDLSLAPAPRLGKTILELHEVGMRYDNSPQLFTDLSLILRQGDRLGLVGRNGSGKTTLLRLITGDLQPTQGRVERGINTQIAYFDQHRTAMDPMSSVREILLPEGGDTVFPGGKATHIASWLSRFAFSGQTHVMRVAQLSGGERNRLAIARFLLTPANLLLLDEPTNDLDLTTLQLLEAALVEFGGCAIVVSHDRYFVDKVATAVLGFNAQGKLDLVQGGYTAWSEAQDASAAPVPLPAAPAAAPPRTPAAKRLSFRDKKELEGMEARITAAEARVSLIEQSLTAPDVWRGDGAEGRALQQELTAAQAETTALYSRWEELMAQA